MFCHLFVEPTTQLSHPLVGLFVCIVYSIQIEVLLLKFIKVSLYRLKVFSFSRSCLLLTRLL